jgi:ubiquinone/menaquinone biosynthesis C-methylase UbiE
MEAHLTQIRDQQKETWNKSSLGWKKWDDLAMDFLQPIGDEMIRQLAPKAGDLVLDVAAGTGEPGLTIAAMIPGGKVIITDLADKMLEIARDHASKRGITNVETVACDVSELPFDDNTFDAISCRMGFMFFPDMLIAAKEMARVLKPGGKIVTSVWAGPEHNFWFTAATSVIHDNVEMPPAASGAPGMFRAGASGLIVSLFEQAGLKNVTETQAASILHAGTTDMYWHFASEAVGPVVAAMSKVDTATKEKIIREVYAKINEKYPDGNVNIDSRAFIIYGEK